VFVPGRLDARTITALVEGIGHRRVSVIGVPGSLSGTRLAELGVARLSYGPWSMNVALTALADFATGALAGGTLPEGVRRLG
jgi:2-methylisocitrate lyase-like PEP mutase family enzyme